MELELLVKLASDGESELNGNTFINDKIGCMRVSIYYVEGTAGQRVLHVIGVIVMSQSLIKQNHWTQKFCDFYHN